jgi:hypothetical protein
MYFPSSQRIFGKAREQTEIGVHTGKCTSTSSLVAEGISRSDQQRNKEKIKSSEIVKHEVKRSKTKDTKKMQNKKVQYHHAKQVD